MLRIEIITVGEMKSSWIKAGVEHYRKLASRYATVSVTSIKEADSAHNKSTTEVLATEGKRLLERRKPRAALIVLDSNAARQLSSEEFAQFFQSKQQTVSQIQFVIGGAFGLSDEVKHAAETLSLSAMTFPHELTLVILLEQVYRALSINAGSKYHK